MVTENQRQVVNSQGLVLAVDFPLPTDKSGRTGNVRDKRGGGKNWRKVLTEKKNIQLCHLTSYIHTFIHAAAVFPLLIDFNGINSSTCALLCLLCQSARHFSSRQNT